MQCIRDLNANSGEFHLIKSAIASSVLTKPLTVSVPELQSYSEVVVEYVSEGGAHQTTIYNVKASDIGATDRNVIMLSRGSGSTAFLEIHESSITVESNQLSFEPPNITPYANGRTAVCYPYNIFAR